LKTHVALFVAFAGGLVGAAGTAWFSSRSAGEAISQLSVVRQRTNDVESPTEANSVALATLEQRMNNLEFNANSEEAQRTTRSAVSATPDPPSPPSREELEQRHRTAIDNIKQETRDYAWASSTEKLLYRDLSTASSASGGRVTSVECRMTGCLATFEWSSYDDAVRNGRWRSLLHARSEANCGREIVLPEPNSPDARYEASMVLNCTDRRAEQQHPM
jgi:hypothetical protein